MTNIASLTGEVAPEELGVVSFNERLLYGRFGWQLTSTPMFDRASAFERLRADLEAFRKAGGETIVETSGIALGRDLPMYKRLSELTGVRIVSSTGFVDQVSSIPPHFATTAYYYRGDDPVWRWQREISGSAAPTHIGTKEYLMFLSSNELTEGMVAPSMVRTGIRAALVRCGAAFEGMTIIEEMAVRAAAMAAHRSGVVVYTDSVVHAPQLLALMKEEELSPDRVVIGHCDDARVADHRRDATLAGEGSWIAYDHIGWEDGADHAMPDDARVELIKAMVEAGHVERILLSCSVVGVGLGVPATSHRYTHLLDSFVPRLNRAGVGDNAIQTMLVDNPRRALTAIGPYGTATEGLRRYHPEFRTGQAGD